MFVRGNMQHWRTEKNKNLEQHMKWNATIHTAIGCLYITADSPDKTRHIYPVIGIYPCRARNMKAKECLANLRANLIKRRFYNLPGAQCSPWFVLPSYLSVLTAYALNVCVWCTVYSSYESESISAHASIEQALYVYCKFSIYLVYIGRKGTV